MIGEQIKKLRVKRGMTQEKLGQLIGVTMQAVSKWERGGVPDAEIVPRIADVLGVSIDVLYGRTSIQSIEESIMEELSLLDDEEGFRKAFSLCWAIEMSLTGQNSLKDKFTFDMLDNLQDDYGNQYYSWMLFDGGMVNARVSCDSRYFFLMPHPQEGYADYFRDMEKLADVFSVLGNKDVLNILFYMYGRRNTPVSLSLIAAKTGLNIVAVEKLMEKLRQCHLVERTMIETENGDIAAYTFCQEQAVVPMLCCAKQIGDEKQLHFGCMYRRTQPLF